MAEIITTFNRTDNEYYKTYAKIVYSISFTDDIDNLQSTAKITMNFYIKPDIYAYCYGATESLYLGLRKGSAKGTLVKNVISPTYTNGVVDSNVYNHVGKTTLSVTYDSTKTYNVYLAAGYTNDLTSRFAPFNMPQSDGSGYYKYETSASNLVVLPKRITSTDCKAPSSILMNSGTPTIFDKSIKLNWSGAGSGTANLINGYRIEYCINNSDWIYLTKVNTSATSGSYTFRPNMSVGSNISFRIRTEGSAGSGYYSSWKTTASVQKNSPPSQVSALDLTRSEFSEDEEVKLYWEKPYDKDNNITGYEIQYSSNGGAWTALKNTSSLSYTFCAKDLVSDELLIKFRVCAIDSYGYKGSYKESATLKRNDYGAVKICVNGSFKKAFAYVCKSGQYKKVQVYVCKNSVYKKGVN